MITDKIDRARSEYENNSSKMRGFLLTVAIVLAVIATAAEGSDKINMMRGMFTGIVPEEKMGPLCDACVDIFAQVNELLNDPAFQDQVPSLGVIEGLSCVIGLLVR